ncbi:ferritin [Porphyromonas loveana]|uniref:Ferritin n=1 Tax=Porphyromonas loveana TaxID=1884669 RepID=A0A2U1FAP6_9PORP|nr:ferritin [Porphyromonas loveana]PVZ09261.1 ferritin [Porphyromonas loveana]
MKLKETVVKAINEQINAEMWSSNLYLSMSVHFAHAGYNGFANWLKKQSMEEMEHAYDMMDYLLKRGGEVKIGAIDAVPQKFASALEVFQQVYDHECKVSEMIENVVKVAATAKDMASQDFFWKYIREQVEEEATASEIVEMIRMSGEQNLIFIDHQLAKR